MTDTALLLSAADSGSRAGTRGRAVFARVAWRNLWRHRMRTWMAAGGIGFAIFLASLMSFLQAGVYGSWIDTATGLVTGHIQLQHPAYFDDPKVGHTLAGGTEIVRAPDDCTRRRQRHAASGGVCTGVGRRTQLRRLGDGSRS